jgi:hypothetical protein
LTAKHGVVPTVTISAPATAGPTTRAVFTTTPFKLTALGRSSGVTSRLMKAWRAGESTICTNPPMTLIVTIDATLASPSTRGSKGEQLGHRGGLGQDE